VEKINNLNIKKLFLQIKKLNLTYKFLIFCCSSTNYLIFIFLQNYLNFKIEKSQPTCLS